MVTGQGIYEVIDNDKYGQHGDALLWLASHYDGPLNVATAYAGLDGLDTLVKAANTNQKAVKLLIGAAPIEGALTGSPDASAVRDRFRESVDALRRERNFSGFPASRRIVVERVSKFIASEQAEVRRYTQRFLHGKAYALGPLNDNGNLIGPGAALVSSANLTHGGLTGNLELGMVHYQPNVVDMTLQWHRRLWEQADNFRDELLELLQPPPLDATPDDVFLRALIGTLRRRAGAGPLRGRTNSLPTRRRRSRPSNNGTLRRRALRRRRRHGQNRDRNRLHPRARRRTRTSCARGRLGPTPRQYVGTTPRNSKPLG